MTWRLDYPNNLHCRIPPFLLIGLFIVVRIPFKSNQYFSSTTAGPITNTTIRPSGRTILGNWLLLWRHTSSDDLQQIAPGGTATLWTIAITNTPIKNQPLSTPLYREGGNTIDPNAYPPQVPAPTHQPNIYAHFVLVVIFVVMSWHLDRVCVIRMAFFFR